MTGIRNLAKSSRANRWTDSSVYWKERGQGSHLYCATWPGKWVFTDLVGDTPVVVPPNHTSSGNNARKDSGAVREVSSQLLGKWAGRARAERAARAKYAESGAAKDCYKYEASSSL